MLDRLGSHHAARAVLDLSGQVVRQLLCSVDHGIERLKRLGNFMRPHEKADGGRFERVHVIRVERTGLDARALQADDERVGLVAQPDEPRQDQLVLLVARQEGVIENLSLERRPATSIDAATKHPTVRPAELAQANWIMRETGSGTRAALTDALGALGLSEGDLTIALELPSNGAVVSAVQGTSGVAALSSAVVTPFIAQGRLVAANFDLPVRRFYALRHKERRLSKAAEVLLQMETRAEDAG